MLTHRSDIDPQPGVHRDVGEIRLRAESLEEQLKRVRHILVTMLIGLHHEARIFLSEHSGVTDQCLVPK